jgi:succinyl-CoA synthetase alpha subunit
MIKYGTHVVGGVTPNKGGTFCLDKPIFNSVSEAKKYLNPDVTVIFVPPAQAAKAISEAIDSEIDLIVCITEGIPQHDMIKVCLLYIRI